MEGIIMSDTATETARQRFLRACKNLQTAAENPRVALDGPEINGLLDELFAAKDAWTDLQHASR